MIPNFEALGLIAEVALGIVGFSAVLIGLNRSADQFSEPDQFRVQLLSFSGFGAFFAALLPFAAFDIHDSTLSWQVVTAALLIYASTGLTIFPQRMLKLRAAGYADLFRTHIFTFQTGILVLVFLLSLLMMIGAIEALATCYTACLLLYLLQSSVAFFRTMFVRWLRGHPRQLGSILGLIGTLMTPTLAGAEGMPPLKKADFQSVAVSFGISPRCPIDPVDIRAAWNATLKDQQLQDSAKSSEAAWPEGKLYFGASCRQTTPNEWIYNLDARWAWRDGDVYPSVPLAAELGHGSEEAIGHVMRHLLTEGLRQYLNANLVDSQSNNEAG